MASVVMTTMIWRAREAMHPMATEPATVEIMSTVAAIPSTRHGRARRFNQRLTCKVASSAMELPTKALMHTVSTRRDAVDHDADEEVHGPLYRHALDKVACATTSDALGIEIVATTAMA